METSLLICRGNQWTGFYMIETSDMKELNEEKLSITSPKKSRYFMC